MIYNYCNNVKKRGSILTRLWVTLKNSAVTENLSDEFLYSLICLALKITRGFIQIQVNIAIKVRPVNAKLRGWHRLHHYFSRPQVIAWLIAPEILFVPRKKKSRGLEGRDFRATQNSWTCESELLY